MNDWLDYKGSGSVQANVVEHGMTFTSGVSFKRPTKSSKAPGMQFQKNSRVYDKLNAELDNVYASISAVKTAKSNWLQAKQQYENSAKALKARTTILRTLLEQGNNKLSSIGSEISRSVTGLSSLQETAITNKQNNVYQKFWAAVGDLNADSIWDTTELDSMIRQINNEVKSNRR